MFYPVDSNSPHADGDDGEDAVLDDEDGEDGEDGQPPEYTVVFLPVERDVNGLFMFRLLLFWERTRMTTAIAMAFLHGTLLYGLNLTIQTGTVLFMLNMAQELEMKLYRVHFDRKYGMSLGDATRKIEYAMRGDNSTALPAILAPTTSDGVLEVCAAEVDIPFRTIYWVMLFWWAMFMLKEFKYIRIQGRALWWVETRVDQRLPLVEKRSLVRLDSWMRGILILCIPGLKITVASCLLFVGAKFLVLQRNPFSLVLKALAMQLVVNFDELMVGSLSSREAMEAFSKSHILYKLKTTELGFLKASHWKNGLGGFVFLAAAVLIVEGFVRGMFPDIFAFRDACLEFNKTFNELYHRPFKAIHHLGLFW